MHRTLVAGLKRLVAVALLLSGGAPSAFELIGHSGGDGPDPLHHVEAANFRHHADQCLGAAAVSSGISPVFELPTLTTLPDRAVVRVEGGRCAVVSHRSDRPTSRGPPSFSA